MAVEFVIDPYNIDEQGFDLTINQDRFYVQEARTRVIENLTSGTIRKLRLRFTHEIMLKLFSDYLGVKGVSVLFTPSPRALVTEIIKDILPDWICDDLLIEKNVLKVVKDNIKLSLQDIYKIILGYQDELLSFSDFSTLYYNDIKTYKLAFDDINCLNFVYQSIRNEISVNHFDIFIDELKKQTDVKKYLKNLSTSSQIEELRSFADLYGFSVALPPIPIASLLSSEICFTLNSKASPNLTKALIKIFNQVIEFTVNNDNTEALDRFPLFAIEEFYEEFVNLLTANYSSKMNLFVKNSLHKIPEKYHGQLNNLIDYHSLESLSLESDIESTLSWVDNYFKILLASWEGNSHIKAQLETEFSDWYLKNMVRVSRSSNNWTSISSSIKSSLNQDEIVVIYMIDALSGAQLTEVSEIFARNFPKCSVSSKYCFAPTPTLTEVGKISVLTGKAPFSVAGDHEQAVLSTYKDYGIDGQGIIVHKSWQHNRPERLNENTKFYLFLENRIDDGLHERKKYEDYSVYKQFVDFTISNITKHAVDVYSAAERWSKKVKIIITADHGVTRSSNIIEYSNNYKKERLIYNFEGNNSSDFLYELVTDYPNLGTCLIPKNRDCFYDSAFSHGGLTPEEVVIPWIEISSNNQSLNPFKLKSHLACCHSVGDRRWLISLNAIKNVSKDDLFFSVESPFSLIGNGNWDDDNQELILSLTSNVEQQGLLEVILNIGYAKKIRETIRLEVEFPKLLIKRDQATSDFDDMLGF